MTNSTGSQVFRSYNHLKRIARDGYLDEGRVDRALGVAQRAAPSKYVTTVESCTCPDSQYRRGVTCKHRLALLMRGEEPVPAAQEEEVDIDPFARFA